MFQTKTPVAMKAIMFAAAILAAAPTVRADEPSYGDMQRKFVESYEAKDYEKALDASKKLHEMRPTVEAHIYNIACMNCLLGNKDAAYTWLEKLADAGYKDADYLQEDADFKMIQDEARFEKILGRMRGEKPSESDDAERKIVKKDDEGKTKRPDKPLTARERQQKIGELTQELMRVAGTDSKKALQVAMEAHEHAIAMKREVEGDDGADPRLKRSADAQYGVTAYNVACMYSLLDKKDESFQYLDTAIKYPMFTENMALQITNDTDFDNIRGDARYAKVMKQFGIEIAPPDPRFSDEKLPKVPDMEPRERFQKVGEISGEIVAASQAGDIDKGLELSLKALAHSKILYDMAEDHEQYGKQVRQLWSQTNYNVSCMYSRKKDNDAAFFYINRAADAGGFFNRNMKDQITEDTDFDNIREDKRYDALLATADRKTSKQAAAPEPEAPKETTVDPAWKVTLPKDHDAAKKAPLIVALHHYHGNMNRTTDRWRAAADKAGAILLTPQGTVGMGDGEFHWGGDLNTVERNVMKAIDEVMDQYKVDTSKIVIGGFSQGGWAAWSLGARNPDTFCGIIPVCGSVNDDDAKRLAEDDCKSLRVWVMLGEDENSRVLDANEDAAKVLRKTGAKVTVKVYEGVAHGFPDDSDKELTNALRFILE